MDERLAVERAKAEFLAKADEDGDWLMGVGLGLVEDSLGLIVNVSPDGRESAERLANSLEPKVPVSIRSIKEIRSRAAAPAAKKAEPDPAFDDLRRAANAKIREAGSE